MTTNFPTGLDTYVNPTGADSLGDAPVLHSAQHSNINDAVESLQAKLGINFSSVETSIDYICNLLLLTQNQHPAARYREITYNSVVSVLPDSVIWYVDSGKTIKLVEKQYSYSPTIKILPVSVTLKLYDGTVLNTLQRTIQDTITYNRVFETSRNRTIT